MRVEPLQANDAASIRALLEASGLPTADLNTAVIHFLGCRDAEGLAGVAGLELLGRVGLLRSLAVRPGLRGGGLGGKLVRAAEQLAELSGVRELYLLTTTAEAFFGRRGYAPADRSAAPAAIRATREFSSLCPSTAAFMSKCLADQSAATGV